MSKCLLWLAFVVLDLCFPDNQRRYTDIKSTSQRCLTASVWKIPLCTSMCSEIWRRQYIYTSKNKCEYRCDLQQQQYTFTASLLPIVNPTGNKTVSIIMTFHLREEIIQMRKIWTKNIYFTVYSCNYSHTLPKKQNFFLKHKITVRILGCGSDHFSSQIIIIFRTVSPNLSYPHMGLVLLEVSYCWRGVFPVHCCLCGVRPWVSSTWVPRNNVGL